MSGMLRKKEVYTTITPIPGFIPRQLAIDILHSHSEVITLNPLVLSHKPIKAPRDAASDEFYSTWYEIEERVQVIPGVGKLGSSKISFKGCFHDMPWGLQSHIYAPFNIDLRNKYRICGNQPGVESPEPLEMGLASLGAPSDGLYLREDIEIKCNVTMVGFVKAQLKAATKEMVSRIIKKAELLDAGVLQGMIEEGKLKTINPADRSNTIRSPLPSPTGTYQVPPSPQVQYQVPRPASLQYARPGSQGHSSPGYQYAQPHQSHQAQQHVQELAGHVPYATGQQQQFAVEMPGDFYHPTASPHLQPPQPSPTPQSSQRDSTASSQGRWSSNDYQPHGSPALSGSRPTSISSDASGGGGAGNGAFRSPGLDHKGFSSELPTHRETPEEHRSEALKKLDGQKQSPSYSYNPADYVKVPMGQQQPQMIQKQPYAQHAMHQQQQQQYYGR